MCVAISGVVADTMLKADSVWVKKSANKLFLIRDGVVIRQYPIALGPNPLGHKMREGDGRTPEGFYYIQGRNPDSKYHLALKISYPDVRDRYRADLRKESPGGEIMIHGLPNELKAGQVLAPNWTQGCLGMRNEHIRQVWDLVDDGTPILIEP